MCTCNKYVCANASKVGQVLHIECKFEMTIYPQNLRYAVLYAKLRWSRLAEARNCDFPFDKPTVVRYYPDYYFNSDSHTRRRRLASLVIMASPKPIYDLRLGAPSRVVEWWKKWTLPIILLSQGYTTQFLFLHSAAKRQSARAFVYCETRRGHTHFLPLPLLPGLLITPHKTFNEISEDGRVKIIKTF